MKNNNRPIHPTSYLLILPLILLAGIAIWAQQTNAQASATAEPKLPAVPYEYAAIPLPQHFFRPAIVNQDNTPANNPITNEGATLGRVLFYDTRLSANNTISCASCHQQAHSFTDSAALSTGFAGGLTGRNSMSLANARYFQPGTFFWDERAATLEDQVLQPIQNEVEMGLTLNEMVARVEATAFYPPLFEQAFGTPQINSERVSLALSQFVRSMVSYQAKYDAGVATNFSNFTPQENQGRQIFTGRGNCDSCHTTDAFVAQEATNNGLDVTTTDAGLGGMTGNVADEGKFKVPSLRNVELTGPYMHNGRFATLSEVVEFYNSGVQPHPNLDPRLRGPNGQPRRLNLTTNEKAALVAFLQTVTDDTFIHDPKFSNPFLNHTIYLPLLQR
jgi:cytochrome c peroxidase